jgi:hypothetical protein
MKYRIYSKKVDYLFLDGIDDIFGLALPYIGDNPPSWKKSQAIKMVNYLNASENREGYVKHDWKIIQVES